MFQPFCLNHVITDLSFIYKKQLQSKTNKVLSNRAHLNENASMRAVAKILRARPSEHPCNFCEQFEQRSNFASTFKLNKTILHPSVGQWLYQVRISGSS